MGQHRPVGVGAGPQVQVAQALTVALDDADRRTAGLSTRPIPVLVAAVAARARPCGSGPVSSSSSKAKDWSKLDRSLRHPTGDVAAGNPRRDGPEVAVPQVRALRADVPSHAGGARGGADGAEALSVVARKDTDVGETLLQRGDELQVSPHGRMLVAHLAQLRAGVGDVVRPSVQGRSRRD